MIPIILASKSPRRKELLSQIGLNFEICESNIDEALTKEDNPKRYVQILAEKKTEAVAIKNEDKIIIGADTIVCVENKILGKPKNFEDAFTMLSNLSGKFHFVLTSYSVIYKRKSLKISNTVKTDVYFRDLTENEINWYIQTKEPFGKAGAYAIQGLAMLFVEKIKGSYTNVIGLPLFELINDLIKHRLIKIEDLKNIHKINS